VLNFGIYGREAFGLWQLLAFGFWLVAAFGFWLLAQKIRNISLSANGVK